MGQLIQLITYHNQLYSMDAYVRLNELYRTAWVSTVNEFLSSEQVPLSCGGLGLSRPPRERLGPTRSDLGADKRRTGTE
jgi:hypothetical protein